MFVLRMIAGVLVVAAGMAGVLFASGPEPRQHQPDYQARAFFGARFEPDRTVLHGAGQSHADFLEYSRALGPSRTPVLYMTYVGLLGRPERIISWGECLKQDLASLSSGEVMPQIGLSMTVGKDEGMGRDAEVAEGLRDDSIAAFRQALKALERPCFVRIGYEFEGRWNGYQPETYKAAFIRIAKALRGANVDAATVWCSAGGSAGDLSLDEVMQYYPGDEWVDWWAIDIFSADEIASRKTAEFCDAAGRHRKPVMIGESTPRHVGVLDGEASVERWFAPYFALIRRRPEIKAFCYINWEWAMHSERTGHRWHDWGDGRIQRNQQVVEYYRREMDRPLYRHARAEALASEGRAPMAAEDSRRMMGRYLLDHAAKAWSDWQAAFETVKTPEEIAAYQQRMRAFFLDKLGGFPERTPLNAQVVGTLRRPGYRVEKVLLESRPGFHVTGALFVPESSEFSAPYPGVLVPCGHSENGKAWDEYQSMAALLALNGMVALVFDPVDQGERMQLIDAKGRYPMWGTKGHTMAGIGCILLGINLATYEVWDGLRVLDYLESRDEVDVERIGCTGNSGGGTQTSMLMALDDRIKAAAPSCYLQHIASQLACSTGDAEQNIHGQLAGGLDHPDYIMMRAPRPVLICAATDDFFDIRGTWEMFRYVKRRYTDIGHAEKVDILENDAKHNYNRTQREGVVRWMARWLQNRVATITEPQLDLFSDRELRCTPRGQVMLLPRERSIYDLNAERESALSARRAERIARMSPKELRCQVRSIAGIRELSALAEPEVDAHAAEADEDGDVLRLTFRPEPGIWLPAVLYSPATAEAPPLILLHENGKNAVAEESRRRMKAGQPVLAIDLRGTGETRPIEQKKFGESIGLDWEDYYKAYVLGRSYVGMRAEDILVCTRWLARRYATDGVAVRAIGHVGVPALHAAALEPGLVTNLHLERTLVSWSHVVRQGRTHHQLINAVHGALRVYDLPDLAALLGERLDVAYPVDARGKPIVEEEHAHEARVRKADVFASGEDGYYAQHIPAVK